MPPYLYAMYSLKTGNATSKRALRSIVVQEMLHMLLACNMLTAIGSAPVIDDPGFVPFPRAAHEPPNPRNTRGTFAPRPTSSTAPTPRS